MKRIAGMALIALLAAALSGAAFAQGHHGHEGWMGGEMDHDKMMGGGMMGAGPMDSHPVFARLPADKREQVRSLRVEAMQTMIAKRADMQSKSLSLGEVMRKFPLDQAAAKKLNDAIAQTRSEMFSLRINTMARVQQIVGKEAWEQLHQGMPHGPGMMPREGRW